MAQALAGKLGEELARDISAAIDALDGTDPESASPMARIRNMRIEVM